MNELLNSELEDELFNQDVLKEREREMLNNITEKKIADGHVLIITGADHIDYFADNIENSYIPLRTEE